MRLVLKKNFFVRGAGGFNRAKTGKVKYFTAKSVSRANFVRYSIVVY